MGMNLVFSTLMPVFIACLAGSAFLSRGEPALLLLGCGSVIWCASGFMTVLSMLLPDSGLRSEPNTFVTIHNLCAWSAALCHLTGTVRATRYAPPVRAPAVWLAAAYTCALAAVLGIVASALSGRMPLFFVLDTGGTAIRYLVLGSASGMFFMAARLLRNSNSPSLSLFVHWYSLALLLLAIGLLAVMVAPGWNSALIWAGRSAQYVGGAYMLVAALATARENGAGGFSLGQPLRETRFRYGVAVASACAALIVRLTFLPWLGSGVTYITFYPAVMIAALYGGFRTGLLAALISIGLAIYFLIDPAGSLVVTRFSDALGIAIFLVGCAGLSFVASALHRAQQRASEAEADLRHASARKRDAQRLLTLNRTLRALHNSSQALVRATDEDALLKEVCRIVDEDCGHALVWVGFAESDAAKSIRVAASAGFEAGYLETLRLTWADTERGRGPTGTAIRTGKASLCRNMLTDPAYLPWRAEATRRGYASSIALPLTCGGRTIGALSLYCREPDPFTEDELKLLTELADDVSCGLSALRLRQANIASENALRTSEKQFRMLFESASNGIFIADEQGRYVDANACGLEMLGLTRPELLGQSIGAIVAEHERHRLPAALDQVRRGHPYTEEWQFVRKDGSLFSGEMNGHLLPDGRMVGILRDITGRKRAEETIQRHLEELRCANAELERFNRAAVGRELQMIELKKQINALLAVSGQPPRYDMTFSQDTAAGAARLPAPGTAPEPEAAPLRPQNARSRPAGAARLPAPGTAHERIDRLCV
jgi:PAS domain S-box-containing protein